MFLKKKRKKIGGGFKRGVLNRKGKEGTNCKRRETCGVCLVLFQEEEKKGKEREMGWCVNGGGEW